MLVRDLMTTDVLSVSAAVPVSSIVELLTDGVAGDGVAGMGERTTASFKVRGGVVELQGYHRSSLTRRALSTLIAGVPDVLRVVDNAAETPPGSISA